MDEELDFVQPHKKIKVNLVPCEDVISRADAHRAIDKWANCREYEYTNATNLLHRRINDAPPVTVQANKEDIHREREQAYMRGYEDGSRKYRTEQSEDAISRQAAIDAAIEAADEWDGGYNISRAEIIAKALEQLPSVSTEKTGRWEKLSVGYGCSKCSLCTNIHGIQDYKYCPNCGAKMGEDGDKD